MKDNIANLRNLKKLKILGRYYINDSLYCFDNVASGIEINFLGTSLSINTKTFTRPRINKEYPMFTTLCVLLDDDINPLNVNLNIENDDLEEITIIKDLEYKDHTVKILKTDDPLISSWGIKEVITDGIFLLYNKERKLNIEVYGDSITSGGDNLIKDGKSLDVVPNTGNGMATYATFAARELDANINVFSRCGLCLYPASSFDTEIVVSKVYNKISPLTLLDWNLGKYIPDIIVISLGTNDELGNMFKIEGFTNACLNLVKNLEHEYHNNSKYIFTYGYMNKNNDIEKALIKAKELLLKESIETYLVKMPTAKIGHPTVEEHYLGAKLLKQLIIDITK